MTRKIRLHSAYSLPDARVNQATRYTEVISTLVLAVPLLAPIIDIQVFLLPIYLWLPFRAAMDAVIYYTMPAREFKNTMLAPRLAYK